MQKSTMYSPPENKLSTLIVLIFNKMMSLVKRVAFTKWARRLFLAQSLFLDIWIMFYELHDAICGLLVKSGKIDGLLFLDILGGVYF